MALIAPSSVRKCVGCFQEHSAESMFRVVRVSSGEVLVEALDRVSSQPGRGAYVCPQASCVEKALRRKGKRTPLSHWLKIPLTEAVLDQVKMSLSKHLS